MYKKITGCLVCCVFYFVFSDNVSAANYVKTISDTPLSKRADTGKRRQYRITNKNFNEIYTQNLQLSTFGNEYFDPHQTLIVSDLVANFVVLNTPKLPVFLVAIPQISIRLFAAEGAPVKSPSYMPGLTLYFRTNKDSYHPEFFSMAYNHHSNGVRGPTLNPDGTFNTDSGKFTTNFYTLTFHAGKQTDKNDIIINCYDAVGLELHSALVGLGYTHALDGKYGFVRINGNWLYNIKRATADAIDKDKKVYKNWQRLQLDFEYIADKYDDYSSLDFKKRLNINLRYYYQFPFMQNVAFLVGAGYRGQDVYNVFFQDSYPYVILGIAGGLSFDIHK